MRLEADKKRRSATGPHYNPNKLLAMTEVGTRGSVRPRILSRHVVRSRPDNLLSSFCQLLVFVAALLFTTVQATPISFYPRRGGASTLMATKTTSATLDCLKTALAGGIAGAVGTVTLYPLDAAKTIRQAAPHRHSSVRAALRYLIRNRSMYRGLGTAVVGALPSSALYFGAYETAKRVLLHHTAKNNQEFSLPGRWAFHATAAACGNLVSSAVFVPKELIKQQLQFGGAAHRTWTSVMVTIVRKKGIAGLYTGYKATVLRNIPSAALRFAIYEELKLAFTVRQDGEVPSFHWKLFAAGAIAGAMASGFMTPVDVLKSRITTGTCPVDVKGCAVHVVSTDGWKALWAGAGSRMVSSAAFSSIGFGTFEGVKRMLCVSKNSLAPEVSASNNRTP